MSQRSNRAEVRNPMLTLPAMQALMQSPKEHRDAMAGICRQISLDARQRAETCWRTHKAPMALYWKCVAVYSGHIARALRMPTPPEGAHE